MLVRKKRAISLENVYEFVFNGKNIASYHFGWAQVVTTSHSAVKKIKEEDEKKEFLRFLPSPSLSLLIGIINTRLAARKKRSTALASSGESVPKAWEDDAVAVAWATVRAEDERCQVIAWNHRNHDTTHVLRFFLRISRFAILLSHRCPTLCSETKRKKQQRRQRQKHHSISGSTRFALCAEQHSKSLFYHLSVEHVKMWKIVPVSLFSATLVFCCFHFIFLPFKSLIKIGWTHSECLKPMGVQYVRALTF